MGSAGAVLALLAASTLSAAGLSEPHAAAEVFDQDYPTAAACDAALAEGRVAGSPELRRLLAQAACHPVAEPGRTAYRVRMHWKRSPLHGAARRR